MKLNYYNYQNLRRYENSLSLRNYWETASWIIQQATLMFEMLCALFPFAPLYEKAQRLWSDASKSLIYIWLVYRENRRNDITSLYANHGNGRAKTEARCLRKFSPVFLSISKATVAAQCSPHIIWHNLLKFLFKTVIQVFLCCWGPM